MFLPLPQKVTPLFRSSSYVPRENPFGPLRFRLAESLQWQLVAPQTNSKLPTLGGRGKKFPKFEKPNEILGKLGKIAYYGYTYGLKPPSSLHLPKGLKIMIINLLGGGNSKILFFTPIWRNDPT